MSVQEDEQQLLKEQFLGRGTNYFRAWSLGEEITSPKYLYDIKLIIDSHPVKYILLRVPGLFFPLSESKEHSHS